MGSPVLLGSGLSKRFRLKENRSLGELIRRHHGPREFWALRDVDLEVNPGEIVAVVGRNGAGKSTLLKLCSGISEPTEGTLRRPNRIAPLVEVGAGFHPELSGRDNIAINARLLGLSRHEVDQRFDEIVDFSELGDSIDRPVRQYSSGMFMRLGFAVAIHTRPELLVVDEVLAVGDLTFQARCMERIREMREQGVGVLFVSHNLNAILTLATRAVFLEKGVVRASGDVSEVVGAYHRSLNSPEARGAGEDDERSELTLEYLHAVDETGHEPPLWEPGSRARMTLGLRAMGAVREGRIGFRFNKDGVGMVGRWVADDNDARIPALAAGELAELEFEFSVNFAEGGYTVDIAAGPEDLQHFTIVANEVYRFGVSVRPGGTGVVDVDPALRVRRVE